MDIRSDLLEHLPCPSCVGEVRVYYEETEERPSDECGVCGGGVQLVRVVYDDEGTGEADGQRD